MPDKKLLRRIVAHRQKLSEYVASVADQWPEVIDSILERQGLSYRGLAAKIGCSASYICHVHTGRESPSERIEAALVEEYCR